MFYKQDLDSIALTKTTKTTPSLSHPEQLNHQPRSQGLLRFQEGGGHIESGVDPGNRVAESLSRDLGHSCRKCARLGKSMIEGTEALSHELFVVGMNNK